MIVTCRFYSLQDYHVIFLLRTAGPTMVYDLDTTLPFPCKFTEYSTQALREDNGLKSQFHRYVF